MTRTENNSQYQNPTLFQAFRTQSENTLQYRSARVFPSRALRHLRSRRSGFVWLV